MEWLKEILKGLENAEDLEKKIAGGIGKNFVSREDFNTLNATKKNLDSQLAELNESLNKGEDFKKKFEDLQKQIADEKATAEQAAKEAKESEEYQNRFNSVVGENKWRDELTQTAVFAEFKKALTDDANKGKGDKDILEALTKDKGYWENPNRPTDMPGMGNTSMSDVEESKMRAIMGLAPKSE